MEELHKDTEVSVAKGSNLAIGEDGSVVVDYHIIYDPAGERVRYNYIWYDHVTKRCYHSFSSMRPRHATCKYAFTSHFAAVFQATKQAVAAVLEHWEVVSSVYSD